MRGQYQLRAPTYLEVVQALIIGIRLENPETALKKALRLIPANEPINSLQPKLKKIWQLYLASCEWWRRSPSRTEKCIADAFLERAPFDVRQKPRDKMQQETLLDVMAAYTKVTQNPQTARSDA